MPPKKSARTVTRAAAAAAQEEESDFEQELWEHVHSQQPGYDDAASNVIQTLVRDPVIDGLEQVYQKREVLKHLFEPCFEGKKVGLPAGFRSICLFSSPPRRRRTSNRRCSSLGPCRGLSTLATTHPRPLPPVRPLWHLNPPRNWSRWCRSPARRPLPSPSSPCPP